MNISLASAYRRLFVLLCLVILCLSTKNVDGLATFPSENNEGDLKNLYIPDSLLASKGIYTHPEPVIMGSDYDIPHGQVHFLPYKKRTIPIELQKALYAHGIVGRRR